MPSLDLSKTFYWLKRAFGSSELLAEANFSPAVHSTIILSVFVGMCVIGVHYRR